jgi:hypothetical protein
VVREICKDRPWFELWRFAPTAARLALLKTYPGVQWDTSARAWLVPCELAETLMEKFDA